MVNSIQVRKDRLWIMKETFKLQGPVNSSKLLWNSLKFKNILIKMLCIKIKLNVMALDGSFIAMRAFDFYIDSCIYCATIRNDV